MKKTFGLILGMLFIEFFMIASIVKAGAAAKEKSIPRPEVVLCATSSGMDTSLFMVFDLDGSIVLGDRKTEVVKLAVPSEEFNPWTYFTRSGDFCVVLAEQDNKVTESTTYGSYRYEYLKFDNTEMSSPVFARQGASEKGFGSVQGKIWRVDGKTKYLIGEESFRDVVTPEGEKITGRMVRLQGNNQKWVTDLGGKIMQQESDGKLVQVGWVGWRKVTTPDGKHLGILMTKLMSKDAKWAGTYDGKLYQDK